MSGDFDELAELVVGAQRGDRGAQGELLVRVQDRVLSLCLGRLAHPELARDAAQDALIDALEHLDQVRDPRALLSWLRRVALKHCDRQLRRERPATVGNVERDLPAPQHDGRDAEADIQRAERAALAHALIDALPEHERVVVALHYLAGAPLSEIGALLEIEANTAKQRLHAARSRLRNHGEEIMTRTLEDLSPSRNRSLARPVQLFVAVRTADLDQVRALLDADPQLVHAQEAWDNDGTLPFGTRATPLVRAAERGHGAVVRLLLERGAPVDGPCGCPTAETPLWGAVVSAKHDAARLLLEHGADPNRPGASGVTPLHAATMRGDAALAQLLLEHGADPDARDTGGRTALDWARERGHGASWQAALAGSAASPHLETGIKALDLFAPIARGSIVRVDGGAGVGRNVLLAELAHATARIEGCAHVWAQWHLQEWEQSEESHLLAETGASEHVHLVTSPEGATESERHTLPRRALERTRELLEAGAEHALLVLFEAPGYRADVRALYADLAQRGAAGTGQGSITTLLVTPFAEVGEQPAPITPPIGGHVLFDRALMGVYHYPAIDPLRCVGAELPARQAEVVARARAALTDLRELAPDLRPQLDALADATRTRIARALRVQAYLTQPFHGTEPFTARPGVSVPRAATVARVGAILDGACDDLAVESLLYGPD